MIYLFGAVFYAIFASGEVQPWAVESTEKKSNENKQKAAYENHAMAEIALER